MLKLPRRIRPWVMLFALWLAIEPLFVSIAEAQELPAPKLNSGPVDGISDIEDVLTPVEYLEYMLELRGSNKEECEAKAWSDWLTTISGLYMMMDAGQQDVFTFYSALRATQEASDIARGALEGIRTAIDKTALGVGFLCKLYPTLRGANMFDGFLKWSKKIEKAMSKNRTFQFLEFMSPPPCWNNPKVSGEGFKSYLRWVKKKTGHNPGPGRTISDTKGIARTCGIGLAVLGLALSSYQLSQSDDLHGARYNSYSLVKNYADIAFGAMTLICMFCIPVVGQVFAAVTLAWMILTTIGDMIGEHNKKWKAAYRASHWFLIQNDPEYKSFYDNRADLRPEEKAASLLLAERDYGSFLSEQQASNDAAAGNAATNEDEKAVQKAKEQEEIGKSVFIELEKQGVLMTYYSQTGFTLPDFDITRLMDLWRKKADYMSWKPSEEEAGQKRGFLATLASIVNPMTYVAWVGDKVDSRGFQQEIKNGDIKRVFFNPDYVLVKKYKNFLMAKNLKGGIYDIVGLRMEQAPFNYVYLLGIDSGAYTSELLFQSFNADAFIIASKEMMYFAKQLESACESMKKIMKENDATIAAMVKNLADTTEIRTALQALVEAYKSDPDTVSEEAYKACHKTFGWQISDKSKKTPSAMIDRYKAQLEEILAYVPLSLSQKAAELVLIIQTVKHNLDTAKLADDFGAEREKILNTTFAQEFTNDAIKKYLKEGSFLDIKGSSQVLGADWLSGIYPAWEELRKQTDLYRDQVRKLSAMAERSNSDTRDGFLGIDYHVTPPAELLEKMNAELAALKEVISEWDSIKDQIDIRVPLAENSELANGVFKEGGFKPVCDTVSMDPATPVMMPMNQ